MPLPKPLEYAITEPPEIVMLLPLPLVPLPLVPLPLAPPPMPAPFAEFAAAAAVKDPVLPVLLEAALSIVRLAKLSFCKAAERTDVVLRVFVPSK